MKTAHAIKIVDQLRAATKNGCKFMTFLYKSEGTGETAIYTINFGISNENACISDKSTLEAFDMSSIPAAKLEEKGLNMTLLQEAKEKILLSLTQTIEKGVSDAYTQKDTYESLGKGISIHNETEEIYISGLEMSKVQVAPPTVEKKKVVSKAPTIAKALLEKTCNFKRLKFRKFILNADHIGGIVTNGEVIEVQV